MFKDKFAGGRPRIPVRPGGPVELDPGVLNAVPAYARLAQYNQARKALIVAQMARTVLPSDAAESLTASLIADTPALKAALSRTVARGLTRHNEAAI